MRPYNWELSAGIQHELLPRVSVSATYIDRWFGNFEVSQNLALDRSDYDPYCVTAPVDPRLPRSGERICGLVDVTPTKVGAQNFITRSSAFYGKQTERWIGADFLVNARMAGLLLQGGLSTGRTTTDNCDVVTKLDPSVSATAPGGPSKYLCHGETPFLNNAKLLGAYTLPWWDVNIAATYQSIPGPAITAAFTARNSQIEGLVGRDGLPRNLSSGPNGTVTVPLVGFGELFGARMHQVDLRVTKTFKAGRSRWQGQVDVFNLLNSNYVLTQNNTYGTNGASWLVPLSILPARIAKVGLQLDF
jgi:hypothetical protein